MRSYVGIGKGNVKDAVRDAVNGIGNPSAIIFLSSFSQIRETAEILAQKFQGIPCIGTLGILWLCWVYTMMPKQNVVL